MLTKWIPAFAGMTNRDGTRLKRLSGTRRHGSTHRPLIRMVIGLSILHAHYEQAKPPAYFDLRAGRIDQNSLVMMGAFVRLYPVILKQKRV